VKDWNVVVTLGAAPLIVPFYLGIIFLRHGKIQTLPDSQPVASSECILCPEKRLKCMCSCAVASIGVRMGGSTPGSRYGSVEGSGEIRLDVCAAVP
jgi:hypothetical protein